MCMFNIKVQWALEIETTSAMLFQTIEGDFYGFGHSIKVKILAKLGPCCLPKLSFHVNVVYIVRLLWLYYHMSVSCNALLGCHICLSLKY